MQTFLHYRYYPEIYSLASWQRNITSVCIFAYRFSSIELKTIFLGHLSHSDDLMLSVFVRRRALKFKHFKLLLNYLANFDQIYCVASLREGELKL